MTLPDDDLFPPEYGAVHPRQTAYEALLGTKDLWLGLVIEAHTRAKKVDEKQLRELKGQDKANIEEAIKDHSTAINAAENELKILHGKNIRAQKALVKKNVELWIHNLRARAKRYRRYAKKEQELAEQANNRQDRERHEANAKADTDEANHDEQMAGELNHDLDESKL